MPDIISGMKYIFCIVLFCCLFWILPLGAQSEPGSEHDISPVPRDHPGYGKAYQRKDLNYWRELEDDQWDMDVDNARFMYEYEIGIFDSQALALGVLPEDLRNVNRFGRAPQTKTVTSSKVFQPTLPNGELNFTFIMMVVCTLILIVVFVLAYRKRSRHAQ